MYSYTYRVLCTVYRPTSIASLYSSYPVACSPYRALPSRSPGRAGAGGPSFAATCCGCPCELRQGSPPLLSETGHCMLCNAMPDVDSADLAIEICLTHCHAPPCAPVSIAPQGGSTGTCTPLAIPLCTLGRAAADKYRNMDTCTSSVDPPIHRAKLFFSFALRPTFSLLPPQNRPSPSPKHLLLPPRKKKEKNPTELLGLQVLLDLPPPSLGLCENLKLNPT